MERKENKWFNDIPCPGKTTLSDGVGYLDRLIGGGGGEQKRFLTPNRREPTKNNRQQKQCSNNKPPIVKQTSVDLDDIKWIEERKKKFPKVGGVSVTSRIQSSVDISPETSQFCSTSAKAANCASPKAENSPLITNPNPKRKTLFQKLMEMDTT